MPATRSGGSLLSCAISLSRRRSYERKTGAASCDIKTRLLESEVRTAQTRRMLCACTHCSPWRFRTIVFERARKIFFDARERNEATKRFHLDVTKFGLRRATARASYGALVLVVR